MTSNRIYKGFDGWKDLVEAFELPPETPEPKYVFAFNVQDFYEEDCVCITSEDGVSFDVVTSGHCSCYGYEGTWEPTTGPIEVPLKMLEAGQFYAFRVNDAEGKSLASEWLDQFKGKK